MTALARSARIAALAASGAVLAGIGVATWYALAPAPGGDVFAECRATRVAGGEAAFGGPLELVDQTGAAVTEVDIFAAPSLLYFGYTWCPDVCPFDVARMAEAAEILEERGQMVTPIFVTVDPARDDVASLADFAEVHHPRMMALTGTEEQIKAAAQAWRVYYARNGDDPEDYLMDHSTFTYLVAEGGVFLDVFRRDGTSEQLADNVGCFLEKL